MDKLALRGALCAVLLAVAGTPAAGDRPACRIEDFAVRLARWNWVEGCVLSECLVLKGTGVLVSRCPQQAAPVVRITGLDAAGLPVASNELMPFIRDLPAGEHPFPIDLWLDHDPGIVTIKVEVVDVHRLAR